jgi:hypothetical protein
VVQGEQEILAKISWHWNEPKRIPIQEQIAKEGKLKRADNVRLGVSLQLACEHGILKRAGRA